MGLETLALVVSSVATTTLGANLLYLGTYALASVGIAYGSQLLQQAFASKPKVPKPEDGSFNLKQNVPPLSYVLGRNKKAGDYIFLEETKGIAFHIVCMAGHQINGYVKHYLHDEVVTLDTNGDVIAPAHFVRGGDRYVNIEMRHGLNAETAYSAVVGNFPSIWTNDHRGDGLATVKMSCATTDAKTYLEVYPQQMPQISSELEGALLYDPRSGNTAYSENLALMRLWHLAHPVGGKMSPIDMYLPEWSNAANVSDQFVTNRDGDLEHRYHGGFWFRSDNSPIDVGRIMDQAAELVVYERADGLVGVHAGEYVAPDIRLTRDSIISLQYDANTRDTTNVLAVRGRFTNIELDYATSDAAIWGNPYIGEDTERSKTIDNQAVQSHNHIQRLQKITAIRANAPRVSILAHYEAAKDVPYRRFVKVHVPPKMDEAIVEITSSPKLSLRNLTIEFSGIVIPASLYDFNAATEEGEPPTTPEKAEESVVPPPEDFNVVIQRESVSGGEPSPYALITWTIPADGGSLSYEIEYQKADLSEAVQSFRIEAGRTEARTPYLPDGVEYRFRMRSLGNGTPSAWTADINRTPVSDADVPAAPIDMQANNSGGTIQVSAVSANDNTRYLVFRCGTTAQSFDDATLLERFSVSANQYIELYDTPGVGTWKYWVGSENISGVPCVTPSSAAVVVT